ncbi:thiol-disulfide oxidoreductase DCC family protein [Fictibacillus phosphorivorans]|uniref:thiol-disulfide oxidoreductase DCC family protein n=1 Tax=Fictibacillus phosphorivorans TaxID=1221500 RepID=UPI00203CD618|nr:thiol-disulfide oxidoreductase DCC family protein [Fictibacillus phosphorivorans]MCM3717610.1 thiol-disulfide oxidoreductase DCC family protein [Fictibacillus phosphorivorans]MCM3775510.1 thiol-disulfide oxidoreductase DCC family protein [Fictibacillus phosphorivorans]
MSDLVKGYPAVLLFDGVCNLCNSSVQFILKNEKKPDLAFAAIQSEAGKKLLAHYKMDPNETNSVILIANNHVYTESDAVLKVTHHLKFPYSLGKVLFVIPKAIRNFFYKKVALNRYKWFGKRESCMIPTPERKKRFLE